MHSASAERRLLVEASTAWSEFKEVFLEIDPHGGFLPAVRAYRQSCTPWFALVRALNAYRTYLLRGGARDAELHESRSRLSRFGQLLQEAEFDGPLRPSYVNRQEQLIQRDLARAAGRGMEGKEAERYLIDVFKRMEAWRGELDTLLTLLDELTAAENQAYTDMVLESALRARDTVPGLDISVEDDLTDRLGRRQLTAYESVDDLLKRDSSREWTFPIFPPRRVFDAVAKCAVHLPLDTDWPTASDLESSVREPGDCVEHLTAGLQMASLNYHRLSVFSQDAGTLAGSDHLPSLVAQAFRTQTLSEVTRRHKDYVLSIVGDGWLDVTHLSHVARAPIAERVAVMLAVCEYLSCQLAVLSHQELRRNGFNGSQTEVRLLQAYDLAADGASYCADRTQELDVNNQGSQALVDVAQRGLSRAGLFLGERPEAWTGQREELLRDVTLPFLLASGAATAEGEVAVYSGKSDIHFRLGAPLGDERHRGVAEFKKWDGISSFRTAWHQLTRQHSTGTESYLAAVMLFYGRGLRKVVDLIVKDLISQGLTATTRFKGAGTLAGADGEVSVRQSNPIPFGVYVFDLAYTNPRTDDVESPGGPTEGMRA